MARRAKASKAATSEVSTSSDDAQMADMEKGNTEVSVPAEADLAPTAPPAMAGAMGSPSSGNSNGRSAKRGLFSRMYGDVGASSADERDRTAAMEWQYFMEPNMELLQSSVPEATSPEDAARIWQERQGPVTPDPEGGAYIDGDAFDTDARVYYRLLRRNYEKNPRPGTGQFEPYYIGKLSNKHNKSHHLPSPYGQRPGIKGW